MVEKRVSERFDEILLEGRDSIYREDLLKYIRSNFEGLNLRNRESLQEILLQIQKNSRDSRRQFIFRKKSKDVRVISIKLTLKKK